MMSVTSKSVDVLGGGKVAQQAMKPVYSLFWATILPRDCSVTTTIQLFFLIAQSQKLLHSEGLEFRTSILW